MLYFPVVENLNDEVSCFQCGKDTSKETTVVTEFPPDGRYRRCCFQCGRMTHFSLRSEVTTDSDKEKVTTDSDKEKVTTDKG